jgi:hypothetical protein
MAHNVYINIILSTDEEKFPKDFGMVSEIKRELTIILQKYPDFKVRRYNFDIIDGDYDLEEDMELDSDAK